MDKNWKTGGTSGSVTASTALLNQEARYLERTTDADVVEIVLLRQSKRGMRSPD